MRIGVIGCGYWGKNLVRNFHQLGVLSAVCDSTPSGQATARGIAPNIQLYESIDDILASSVDGVVIATPAETHFTIAEKALRIGKDVFVEKPLALTYDEGCILVELAESNQRILLVGHVLEYHPAIVRMMEMVQSGELGKLHYVYSNRLSLGKIRREENILWSFAPHDVAVILRLMGGMPFEVTACGGNYVQPNIADVTVTNFLFDNGVRAHIFVSWLHPFKEQRLVVIGSEKMAVFDDVSKELILYDQKVEWQEGQPVPVKSEGLKVDYEPHEPLRLECQAFIDAIRTREQPLTDGYSGLRVLRILEAAQRSLITSGEPVRLPMDNLNHRDSVTTQRSSHSEPTTETSVENGLVSILAAS